VIRLQIAGPDSELAGPASHLGGWAHFWGKWVFGFNPKHHCAACLLGHWVSGLKPTMPVGLAQLEGPAGWPYLYICGVAAPRSWANNFHMALAPEPGGVVEMETWNGYRITAGDVRRIEIQPVPRGFGGLPDSFTTCRNWQFGIQQFGPAGKWYSGGGGGRRGFYKARLAKAQTREAVEPIITEIYQKARIAPYRENCLRLVALRLVELGEPDAIAWAEARLSEARLQTVIEAAAQKGLAAPAERHPSPPAQASMWQGDAGG
jgi:hypothetical protein